MITELRLTDLGVIADATIDLGPGLTAITGETGAGKTMLLTGLGLLLGGRADAAAVRPGAERAAVEGRVVPTESARRTALEAGAVLDDDELVIVRTIAAQGRSRAHLGGRGVPMAILAQVAADLVTVHGQSDQIRLRTAAAQRAALDAFAGPEHAVALRELERRHAERRRIAEKLELWDGEAAGRSTELAGLQDALRRIEALEPVSGELDRLKEESRRLSNVDALLTLALTVRTSLAGDEDGIEPGAVTLVERARRAAEGGAEHDPEVSDWAVRLTEVSHLLNDLVTEASSYAGGLEADPGRLEQVHARRAALTDLVRAYGDAGEGDALAPVLALAERARERIAELTSPSLRRESLLGELEAATSAELESAGRVSEGRRRAAVELSEAVDAELTGLAMRGAHLEVALQPREQISAWGAEDVELRLSAYPGAPALPLSKGASGGELSRIMLAVEVALASRAADRGELPVFIFDEVDAGVGGKAASAVGQRLAELARHTQVVVVTHLAQVAAYADHQLVVTKAPGADGAVATTIRPVSGARRESEIARMLSGEDSPTARTHAAELLGRHDVRR